MVKWSSGRKFPILGFIKDLSILGILRREFLFDFLHCLGQGSGEHEFLDVGMILSKYLPEGGCIPLLGINLSGILRFISFNCSKIS